MRAWLVPATAAMAVVSGVGCGAPAAMAQGAEPPLAAGDLSPSQQRTVHTHRWVLLNPSADIPLDLRETAAVELLDMQVQPAIAVLDEGLRGGQPVVMGAIITSLETAHVLPPSLLEPLLLALQTSEVDIVQRLAALLPRYGRTALDAVAAAAADTGLAASARVGPLLALGYFEGRESINALMTVLAGTPRSSREIIDATCQSLERLTNERFGADPDRWKTWWARHKDDADQNPPELMGELRDRIEELEKRLREQEAQIDTMAQRYVDELRKNFMALAAAEQYAELQTLLVDVYTQVRRFAVSRVERLMRDSELPPDDIQQQLAARVSDSGESPELRVSAARLLSALSYPEIPELVAAALAETTDGATAASYLDILASQAPASSLDAVLAWISDQQASGAAADVLWGLVQADRVPADRMPGVTYLAVEQMSETPSPELARLFAAIAPVGELDRVRLILGDVAQADAMRSAVADGLAFRGDDATLRLHAGDPAVYPKLVGLISRGASTLDTLGDLTALGPLEPHEQLWIDSVQHIASGLPADQLLAADDVLQGVPLFDESMRAGILQPAADLPNDSLEVPIRDPLLIRLASLRLSLQDATAAHGLYERLDPASLTVELLPSRFRAAALAGQYDFAASLDPDDMSWVRLLAAVADQDTDAAVPLRDEILRRFADTMTPEAAAIFAEANGKLPAQPSTDPTVIAQPSNGGD